MIHGQMVKVVACGARGPGFNHSYFQMVHLYTGGGEKLRTWETKIVQFPCTWT